MKPPNLKIPPHTHVSQFGATVSLTFPLISEADEFVEWLRWIDGLTEPTDLVAMKSSPEKIQ
jgi:hypothetical protein